MHLRRDLLEKEELFDDQIVIIKESLIDILLDIIVQVRLDMEWFIRFLDLFDPHIQLVQFLIDQIFKVVRGVEDTVDTTHQEREEYKTDELEHNRE